MKSFKFYFLLINFKEKNMAERLALFSMLLV